MPRAHLSFKFELSQILISRIEPRNEYLSIESLSRFNLAGGLDAFLANQNMSEFSDFIQSENLNENIESISATFPIRYGFIKPVSVDPDGTPSLEQAFIDWQAAQINPDIQNSHVILKPSDYSHNNERLVLGIHKHCLSMARALESTLGVTAKHVGFASLDAFHYVELHGKLKQERDALFLSIEENHVEYAPHLEGILKEANALYLDDPTDVQALGLELRQALDYILSDTYRFNLTRIFLTGPKATKALAKQLSDMLAAPVEIVTNYGDIELSSRIDLPIALQSILAAPLLD